MDSQLIDSSEDTVHNQFGPHGEMVPKNLVIMDKWSPTNLVRLDKRFLEYSKGQEVEDKKSGDQTGSGPNVLQPSMCICHYKKLPC